MKRLLLIIFYTFLVGLLIGTPKIAHAKILLQDNFNDNSITDGIPVNWEIFAGPGGYWNINNGEVEGSVVKSGPDTFSYLVAGDNEWSNYSFSTKLMGIEGIDKKIMIRYQNPGTRYDLNLMSGAGVFFQKWLNGVDMGYVATGFSNSDFIWYKVRVEAINNTFRIFVNDNLLITYTDTSSDINNPPILTGKIGLQVWPGYYNGFGSITTTRFDDVLVCDFDGPCEMPTATPTPTITPTPTPTPLPPVVLLPGMGSSWNYETIIQGQDKPQNEWGPIPGLKLYDNLINTLKNAGYKTDGDAKNLFIFYYNWTKPIETIATDLKNYIENVVHPSPNTNINLIGHSLGGMVGRTYLQNNPGHLVNKLITLGSPHQGSPTVYYLWEGGQLEKSLDPLQRIATSILIHSRSPTTTTAKAIKTLAPSVKDLLPSFNYLKYNSFEKPLTEMNQKNDWLINLNASPPGYLTSHLNSLIGNIPNSVGEWINVEDRGWLDKVLEIWPDGKPINEEKNNGDRTVLLKSAQLNGVSVFTLDGLDHGTIVTSAAAQQKIIDVLGLSPTSISEETSSLIDFPILVFYIASPAVITSIYDPSNQPVGFIENKIAIIPNAIPGQYKINITGTDNGIYNLHIGQLLPDKTDLWTTVSATSQNGLSLMYLINFNPTSPKENPLVDPTGENNLKSALVNIGLLKKMPLSKIAQFQLNQILILINRKNYEEAIRLLYLLRQQTQTREIKNQIQNIIDSLEQVYIQNSKGKYNQELLKNEKEMANVLFKKMENSLKIRSDRNKAKPEDGLLFLLAQKKLDNANLTSSFESHIYALGATKLSEEGIASFTDLHTPRVW